MSNFYLCDMCAYSCGKKLNSSCKCTVKDMYVSKIIRYDTDKRSANELCKYFEVVQSEL